MLSRWLQLVAAAAGAVDSLMIDWNSDVAALASGVPA